MSSLGKHKQTMLYHLGNMAYRTNSTLKREPTTGRILGNKEASALSGRDYREGWEPKVQSWETGRPLRSLTQSLTVRLP